MSALITKGGENPLLFICKPDYYISNFAYIWFLKSKSRIPSRPNSLNNKCLKNKLYTCSRI
jgi:hypothetical protein